MRSALVVGASGTIGAALFKHLKFTGASVWGTTHKREQLSDNTFFLNLSDEHSWDFPDNTFDVAYLCAGVCRMALCEENPSGAYQVNIVGMKKLIQRLIKNGTFIVYLSTNQVFSGETAYESATASYQPLNEYGRQKAEMENWIKSYCQHFAIVRLTKVVEPNMSLVKNWISQLTQDQPINAFHDMPLAPVSLRHVLDVLTTVGQKKQTGFYQVSGAKDISYFDLAQYLVQHLKRQSSLVQSVSALDSGIKKIFLPRFTTLDCSSTIALCGVKPPHFSEVLSECFDL